MLERPSLSHAGVTTPHFLNISLEKTGYSRSSCSLDLLTSPANSVPEFSVLCIRFEVVLNGLHLCLHHFEIHFYSGASTPSSPHLFMPLPRHHELRSSHDGISEFFLNFVHTITVWRFLSELFRDHCSHSSSNVWISRQAL